MKLTHNRIQEMSGEFTYLRGGEYYRAGLVRSLAWEGRNLLANVHGSGKRSYKVSGTFGQGKPSLRCTCPNNLGGLCKHGVAVLLYLIDHGEVIDDGGSEDDLSNNEISTAKTQMTAAPSVDAGLHHFLTTAYAPPRIEIGLTIRNGNINSENGISLTVTIASNGSMHKVNDINNLLSPARTILNDQFPVLSSFSNDQRALLFMLQGFLPPANAFQNNSSWKIKPFQLALLIDHCADAGNIDILFNKDRRRISIIRDPRIGLTVTLRSTAEDTISVTAALNNPQDPEHPINFDQIIAGKNLWTLFQDTAVFQALHSKIELGFLEHFLGEPCELSGDERKKFIADILPGVKAYAAVSMDDPLRYASRINKSTFVPVYAIDEERGDLHLTLAFEYGPNRINYQEHDSTTYIETTDTEGLALLRRDIAAENQTARTLVSEHHFFWNQAKQRFILSSADDIFTFLSERIQELSRNGTVTLSAKARSLYNNDVMVGPRVRLSNANIDWFAYNITLAKGGEDLDIPEKILTTHLGLGKKFIRLKNGEFVRIDTAAFEALSTLLQDREHKGRLMLAHIPFVIDELKAKGIAVLPDPQTQALYEQLKAFKGIDPVETPQALHGVLRDYQRHGIDWMTFLKKFRFGGILADEMGLGKTLQALIMIQHDIAAGNTLPSLVVCPTTLVWNWEAEVLKFFPGIKPLVITGNDRLKSIKKIPDSTIIITSYALLRRDIDQYCTHTFQFLILDEAQNIKNRHTISARVTKQLNAAHRLALTGTPLENSLADIWSIFDFLMPSFLGSYEYFRNNYELPITQDQNSAKLQELSRRIAPFVLRRLKKDVIKEIPEKIEQTAYCELEPAQAKLYATMANKAKVEVIKAYRSKGFNRSRLLILSLILRLRQICCHPELAGIDLKHRIGISAKTDLFKEMLQELLSSGHRVLIFSQFVQMLGILRDHLDKEKIVYEYMDGQTKDRHKRVDHFNNDPKVQVFLLSLKVGGLGLNLTSADSVILYEPWWNPAVEQQAIDRTHRIGQKNSVLAYHLIARGTIEEKIVELQQRKKYLMNAIVLSDESIAKQIGWEDIKFLLDIKDDAA
jgi:SNF2 family DNA or RNA helicase